MIKTKISFLLFFIFIAASRFYSAVEVKNSRIGGNGTLAVGSQITVYNEKYAPSTTWWNIYESISHDALVIFGVDETRHKDYTVDFSTTITYNVSAYANNGAVTNFTGETLSFTYKKSGVYSDKEVKKFGNYAKLVITVTAISSQNASTSASIANPAELYLEGEVRSTCYYKFTSVYLIPGYTPADFNYNVITRPCGGSTCPAEIELYWPYYQGAEEYEVEWTWVDNYPGAPGIFDFSHDATRIITNNTYYRIPLVYERGFLTFRYRCIGKKGTNAGDRLETPWSSTTFYPDFGYIAGLPANFKYEITSGNSNTADNMNWSATMTFAEDGKKGAGVDYLDGLLMQRQSQSKLNTDSKIMAGQTIYDFQGRPAVSVLPAPVNASQFQYQTALSKNASGALYSKADFDPDVSACTNATQPMNKVSSTGAANYYSPSNTNQAGAQGYVPDAGEYPFVQVEYTPDNTGRVSSQTMPGAAHKLGSGHESRFFYANPAQAEISRLFGSEAGNVAHYDKEMAVDANGQISATYKDLYNRVVATALMGDKPAALDPIANYNNTTPIVDDILKFNLKDPNDFKLTATKNIFVEAAGSVQTFKYEFTPQDFNDAACTALKCFDCIYEVELSITDECGAELSKSGFPAGQTAKQVVGAPVTQANVATCDANVLFELSTSPISVTFPKIGVYKITKTLKVSNTPVEQYINEYLQTGNTCVKTLSDFVTEQTNAIDFSTCGSDCQSCSTSVVNYIAAHPGALTTAQITKLYEDCGENCAQADPCAASRQAMLLDFFPGSGQYALYTADANGNYVTCTDETSIFYSSSRLKRYTQVAFPGIVVTLPDGTSIAPSGMTPQQFINNFKPEWAAFFLKYHPEYAYLAFCEQNTASDLYDFGMLQVNTFDEACQKGFLKPLTGTGSSCISACTTANYDPFFASGGMGLTANDAVALAGFTDAFGYPTSDYAGRGNIAYTYKDLMLYAFNTRYPIYSNTNTDIYNMARLQAGSSLNFGCDPCTKDKEWMQFRALYLNYKMRLVAQRKTDFVMAKPAPANTQNTGFNGCMTNSGFAGFVPNGPGVLPVTNNSTGLFPTSPAPTSLNFLPFTFNGNTQHQNNLYYTFMVYPINKTPKAKTAVGCQQVDYNPYGGDVRNCSGPSLYGDLLQPCSYDNLPHFYTKTARFGQGALDITSMVNNYNATVPTPAPILPSVSQVVPSINGNVSQNYCTDICSSYADELMNKIKSCNPSIDPSSGSYNATIFNTVKSQLIDVCVNGCNSSNPFGASTVASAHPGGPAPNSFDSFAEVLTYYFGTTTADCDPDLIGVPRPYSPNGFNISGVVNNPPKLNTCGCDKILNAKYGFLNNTLPAGVTTAEQYFAYLYSAPLPNFSALECKCQDAWGSTLNNWYTTTQTNQLGWSPSQQFALTSNSPVSGVPAFLDCEKPCLTCTTVVNKINAYNLAHPTYTASNNYSTLLENYLNRQFQFNLSYADYMDFYDQCQAGTCAQQFAVMTKLKNIISEWIVVYNNSLPAGPFNPSVPFHSSGSPAIPSLFNTPGTPDFLSCPTANASTTSSGLMKKPVIYSSSLFQSSGNGVNFYNIVDGANGKSCNACEIVFDVLGLSNSTPMSSPPTVTSVNLINSTDFNFTLSNNTSISGGRCSCLPAITPCNLTLCDKPLNVNPPFADDCGTRLINNAYNNALALFNAQNTAIKDNFTKRYKEKCLQLTDEKLERSYNLREYNYTLYYYDQAGNLTKTVPPKGVTLLAAASYNTLPAHTYVTNYSYQSYSAPLTAKSPDETGTTDYIYDRLGRLVASANAEQKNVSNRVSYTFYDKLNRTSEVGEIDFYSPANVYSYMSTHNGFFDPTAVLRKNVIHTYYDRPVNTAIAALFPGGAQQNLRNRVSCVNYEDVGDQGDNTFKYATHYSYDDHGNVKTIVQENRDISPLPLQNKHCFTIEYEYDLVSGNVIKTSYQKGQPDAFFHRYEYDADNRLHLVLTSKDDIVYDRDAKYFYYEHGPLARKELGEQKVHAEDYAYTIMGWLKAVNGNLLDPTSDIGKDGDNSSYSTVVNDIHKYFGRDAFAYNLNYFTQGSLKDYTAIKNAGFNTGTNKNPIAAIANINTGSGAFDLQLDGPDLFNGNISSMVTSIIDKDPTNSIVDKTAFPQITAYRYDQLHRLKQSKAHRSMNFTTNAWNSGSSYDDSYKNQFTYDLNGNILTNMRHGVTTGLVSGLNLNMDNLSYIYETTSNRLVGVNDAATASPYTTDIKGTSSAVPGSTSTYDYSYNEIGSLIKDNKEFIADIQWTPDRKVKAVIRNASAMFAAGKNLPDVFYEYDANRQRVSKTLKPRSSAAPYNYKLEHEWTTTYYVRDASGNVMGTYDKLFTGSSSMTWEISTNTQEIYGSGKLGNDRRQAPAVIASGGYASSSGPVYTQNTLPAFPGFSKVRHMLGDGNYELSNHLGNVITTISDRKLPVTGVGGPCLANFDMATGVPAPIVPQNMALSASTGALVCTLQPGLSGIDAKLYTNIPAGSYIISYDWNPGTLVPSDGVFGVPFDYDGTHHFGTYFFNSGTVPPAGHYSFVYTPGTIGTNVHVYVAFYSYGASANGHYFSIDNLSICPVNGNNGSISYYTADVLENHDYYPGGMTMPGRDWMNGNKYRYSHNGHEKEDAIFVGAQSAENWMYDSRISRRWERDPLAYSWQSPYAAFNNNPIKYADPLGLKGEDIIEKTWDSKSKSYVETNKVEEKSGTDTYIFRGGVLDNQRMDFNLVTGESSWSGGNNSSRFSYGAVMSGAMQRANNPSSINQGRTSLCGPTAITQVLAEKDKRGFIELVSNLYNKDSKNNDAYSKMGVTASDWILLSGLKNATSLLPYGNQTNSGGLEGIQGMTTPGQMQNMANQLGFKTYENSLSVLPGVGSVDKFFANLNAHAAQGRMIIMLVNSDVINSNSQSTIPNHWIIYNANSYKAFTDGCFQFNAQTWGDDKVQFGPVNKARADLKGLFGALIIDK